MTTRTYQLTLTVEVHEQDDLDHFQPDTVVASIPDLGIAWVSSNDGEALRNFFDFFVRGDLVFDWEKFTKGERAIVARALREQEDA